MPWRSTCTASLVLAIFGNLTLRPVSPPAASPAIPGQPDQIVESHPPSPFPLPCPLPFIGLANYRFSRRPETFSRPKPAWSTRGARQRLHGGACSCMRSSDFAEKLFNHARFCQSRYGGIPRKARTTASQREWLWPARIGLGPSKHQSLPTVFLQPARLGYSSPAAPAEDKAFQNDPLEWACSGSWRRTPNRHRDPWACAVGGPLSPITASSHRHVVVTAVAGSRGLQVSPHQPWGRMRLGELHCCIWSSKPISLDG
jgi:hypothetical protein